MKRNTLIATLTIFLLAWTEMTACQQHFPEERVDIQSSVEVPEAQPTDVDILLEILKKLTTATYDKQLSKYFDGTLVSEQTISAPPYELISRGYNIHEFELYNGICDVISIYSNGQEFAQLELGFQRTTASLEAINKDLGDYFIGQVEAEYAGGRLSVNSLYELNGFAINIITLKDNQKAGNYDISKDDVFFISITAKKYFNDISSSSFGHEIR